MLCSWYLFSKIKKVFILGDKISISLRSLKIFVLLIAWLHEFPIRNSKQQKIKKPQTQIGLKLALNSKNSKFVIEDFVKPCGGEKLKILTFPSAKPTASIWG